MVTLTRPILIPTKNLKTRLLDKMKIRIIGIADRTVDIDTGDYLRAKEEKRLHEFMDPYVRETPFDVTYAPEEDFG